MTSPTSSASTSTSRRGWPSASTHVPRIEAIARGHCGRGGGVERAREHADAIEHLLLERGEQLVRPLDRGAQRLVALHRAAPPAGEEPEPLVEQTGDLGRASSTPLAPRPTRWRAGCRRDDGRSRRPRRRCLASNANPARGGGTFDEETHRRRSPPRRRRRRRWWRARQRPQRQQLLAGHGQPLATRRQDRHLGARCRTASTKRPTGSSRCSQLSSTSRIRLAARNRGRSPPAINPRAGRRPTGRHRSGTAVGSRDRRELAQPRAVGEAGAPRRPPAARGGSCRHRRYR